MTQIADAPWIREAELNGPPVAEEINYHCPVCGCEEPESFYFDRTGEIVGCSECIVRQDAYEFMSEKLEEERKCRE